MTINELIKKVFRDSGLTYDEISQKTGISKSTLHGYASGRTKRIPLSALKKITNAFNVPVEYWMSADKVSSIRTPKVKISSPFKEDISDEDFGEMHPLIVSPEEKQILTENALHGENKERKLMSELLQLTEWYQLGMFSKEEYEIGKKFILNMMEE